MTAPLTVAIALFPEFEELDAVGPWEVLSYWAQNVAERDVRVITVAASIEPVQAAKGLRVIPDHTLHDAGPIDVFVMPGGWGTRAMLRDDEPLLPALRDMAERGTLMTSVCTGSLVYAYAGLLKDRPATTHWQNLELLQSLDPSIELRPDDRFVDDGNVVTSAGVSAGIDMALHLIVRLDSADAARATRRGIQYDPQPPV